MSEEYDPEAESDLRRRAAWLLGMLVLVAALVVTIMVTVLGGSGDDDNKTVADPGPSLTDTASSPAPATSPRSRAGSSTGNASSDASSGDPSGSSPGAGASTTAGGRASCPDQQACVLKGDVGDAGSAINAYRTDNGQKSVPVTVSAAAQKCALNNGSGCSGGWAETQLASRDGKMAVQKILQFGKLLDPGVESIEVGWAYDPGAKQYYFAIIRNG